MRIRYAGIALVLTWIISVGISVVVSITATQRTVRAERQATCEVIQTQNAVYQETPPSTPAGKNAAKAWLDLSRRFRCGEE